MQEFIKRLQGEIQKRLMIFGFGREYVYSIFGILVGIVSLFYKSNSLSKENSIGLIVTIFSGLSISYKFLMETVELKERNNEFLELEGEDYKEKICLSDRYKNSGYNIFDFWVKGNNERFVMSHKVNEMLYKGDSILKLREAGAFVLAKEIKQIAPFALNKAFMTNRVLYNSSLVRLTDDIFLDEKIESIRIQKTSYFHGLCTNEMVYKKLKSFLKLENGFFEGKKLLVDDNYVLHDLSVSSCSNYLGVSTLAITSDKKIILLKQSARAGVNEGRWAPSGSGSVDYEDFKKLKKSKGEKNICLRELLANAMERELREECGFKNKDIKMKTKIIGFARLIERGGKPDFFGVTYIDAKDISSLSWETQDKHFIEFNNYHDLVENLGKFISDEQDKGEISIQVYIIANILKYFYENNIDIIL